MSTPEPEKLVVRRRYPGTPDELFAEWTDPAGTRAWMCPGDIVTADVTLDVRVGGALRIVMRSAARAYEHRGQFTIVERPSRLAFTWIAEATDGEPTLVTVTFVAVDAATCEVVLTHEQFPRAEVRERYSGGWARILERLAETRAARSS